MLTPSKLPALAGMSRAQIQARANQKLEHSRAKLGNPKAHKQSYGGLVEIGESIKRC